MNSQNSNRAGRFYARPRLKLTRQTVQMATPSSLPTWRGRVTVIGGTAYHGQIKKSIFSVQNFQLPLQGILTMHAGVSEGTEGLSAIHAGLSGTGKTTLSNTGHPVADDQIVIEINSSDAQAVISNMEEVNTRRPRTSYARKSRKPMMPLSGVRRLRTSPMMLMVSQIMQMGPSLPMAGLAIHSSMSRRQSQAARLKHRQILPFSRGRFRRVTTRGETVCEGSMFHFACGFTSKMPGTEKDQRACTYFQ